MQISLDVTLERSLAVNVTTAAFSSHSYVFLYSSLPLFESRYNAIPPCPILQSCSSPVPCWHFLSRRHSDLFIASLSPLTRAERWHHWDESMGRFRLLWLSLFILFHCSRCWYTILSTAGGKKVGVVYIDILRLTHCQVVGRITRSKLRIACFVAPKTRYHNGRIATWCCGRNNPQRQMST